MDGEGREQLQINKPEIIQRQGDEDVSERTKVTFPKPQKKRSGGKFIFLIIFLLAVAGFVYFIFSKKEDSTSEPTPTPQQEQMTPTPTTAPQIERDEVKIEILNGTGISGEAAFLQKELGELGYPDIDLGNAKSQDYEAAEVVFDREIDSAVKDEIMDKLKDLYNDVESSSEDLSGKDIQIYTGLRPGQSFPATATPTPKTTSTPQATSTPTSTSSATPTP